MARPKPTVADATPATLSKASRQYLYQQLASIVRAEIADGVHRPGDRLPSMDQLAEAHGVNKITVRKAIQALADEGLIYSVPAQGTYVTGGGPAASNHSGVLTIGVFSYDLTAGDNGPYHMAFVTGMQRALNERGAHLALLTAPAGESPSMALARIQAAKLDGVIYVGNFDPPVLSLLIAKGPPAVLLDGYYPRIPVDTVVVDNEGGGTLACEHLLQLGHREIAIVGGKPQHLATRERLRGVHDAWSASGLRQAPRLFHGDFGLADGAAAMRQILAEGAPSAVFFLNDEMAAGGMQALHAHGGLQVPRDLSVIGFDDTIVGRALSPALTTVHIPNGEMGELAVRKLFERRQAPGATPSETRLRTSLCVRASTAPPRA